MATLGKSIFTTWNLSEEEELMGRVLTDLNKKYLQNTIANYAEQKLNIPFTPENIHKYAQQEAELTGQILILQHLITLSTEAEEILATNARLRKEEEEEDINNPSKYRTGFIQPTLPE